MPRIYRIDPSYPDAAILKHAAGIVKQGGLIIYPTETFYGIGVIISDEIALQRLFAVKGREHGKPVLLLIQDIAAIAELSPSVSAPAQTLAQKFWPGPLMLLFTAAPRLSHFLTGDEGKIGCRISSNPVAHSLLKFTGEPITSTSANQSGGKSPACINEISPGLLDAVDIVLDAGSTPGGLPSTVIDVSEVPFRVVREGVLSSQDVLKC
jgi:L-threonylcarbamoyladenylate synthase